MYICLDGGSINTFMDPSHKFDFASDPHLSSPSVYKSLNGKLIYLTHTSWYLFLCLHVKSTTVKSNLYTSISSLPHALIHQDSNNTMTHIQIFFWHCINRIHRSRLGSLLRNSSINHWLLLLHRHLDHIMEKQKTTYSLSFICWNGVPSLS